MKVFELKNGFTVNLLTRKDIIDSWMIQKEKFRNMYCCPNCRNILTIDNVEKNMFCENESCTNMDIYKL
jgi:hypothetical protein